MLSDCAQWLRDTLNKHGRANVKLIRAEARKMGWTRGKLKAAREELGVKTHHDPARDEWHWYL